MPFDIAKYAYVFVFIARLKYQSFETFHLCNIPFCKSLLFSVFLI